MRRHCGPADRKDIWPVTSGDLSTEVLEGNTGYLEDSRQTEGRW